MRGPTVALDYDQDNVGEALRLSGLSPEGLERVGNHLLLKGKVPHEGVLPLIFNKLNRATGKFSPRLMAKLVNYKFGSGENDFDLSLSVVHQRAGLREGRMSLPACYFELQGLLTLGLSCYFPPPRWVLHTLKDPRGKIVYQGRLRVSTILDRGVERDGEFWWDREEMEGLPGRDFDFEPEYGLMFVGSGPQVVEVTKSGGDWEPF